MKDKYGEYVDISIAGIIQQFRRIFPGSFIMGSPPNEPGRRDDERQHKVTLTRGFWLADSACPQKLWEAVMGENPSRFKGVTRPVETVSWDDCMRFIRRLNDESPGGFRLPTEAEWEYCCRAGTTTPYSFGRQIETELVNYDGRFPYNNGAKGEYRGKTVEVKSLPCNDWGLYGMHGNVYEWCYDWYGEYPIESVTNPTGPSSGVFRVLRGGGWFDVARVARSAFRGRSWPSFRLAGSGFRLALSEKD